MKLRLLDLYCGAGGASMGYARAGFEVTGVDINPMPRYPFTFVQADALEYLTQHGHKYDVIHASPECQGYTQMKAFVKYDYPRMIAIVRELLKDTGLPYIIENVEGARSELCNPVTLCGAMFPDIRTYRHRLFESNVPLLPPYPCSGNHHDNTPAAGSGKSSKGFMAITSGGIRGVKKAESDQAIGIDWMTNNEKAESFPPQYTHWIACQVMEFLGHQSVTRPTVRALQYDMFGAVS